MRMRLRETPWDRDLDDLRDNPWRICPVCGDRWRPWHASVLPCHAKCLLRPEDQDVILDAPGGEMAIAERLGLPHSVVRASIAAARRRRSKS